jgi:hypothetical protein
MFLALALGVVGPAGPAAADTTSALPLTIRLEFYGGDTTLDTTPATGVTVHVLADLTSEFSGQSAISVSVTFASGLTPTLCTEFLGPQSVGGATWSPVNLNCGSGDPDDDGIGGVHPPGLVAHIEQFVELGAGTFGTLHLGAITFDALTPGSYTITPFFDSESDGWTDANFGTHQTATFESATVNVPEPRASLLSAMACLSLATLARINRRIR